MKKLFAISIMMTALSAGYAAPSDKSAEDQSFVSEAARGGKMEVELGRIAVKNGSSQEVKQFGQQMVTDHTKLNDELGAVAEKEGFQVPNRLDPKQESEVQSLSKLSGKAFDEKYTHLMVEDHSKDLAAFQEAESTTKQSGLKKAIGDAIPVIQHHLEMAKATEKEIAGQ